MIMLIGLSACGVADVTSGATPQSASTTPGGSTTGGSTTGSTTGTPIGGTATGGTTGTGTTDPNTVDPNTVMQDPNNPTSTLDANKLPQNVFYNIVSNSNDTGDSNTANGDTLPGGITGDTNIIVLVFSTRADYCSALYNNDVPSSSVNVRLEAMEAQSLAGVFTGMNQATVGIEEVVGAAPTCSESSTTALPASFLLGSETRAQNATAKVTVTVTLQGVQQHTVTLQAMKCSALTTSNDIAATQASGGTCIN